MARTATAAGKEGALCVRFDRTEMVRLNTAGLAANMAVKDTSVWIVARVIDVPDHPVHPERYELDPPHPFGAISGMFLERVGGTK